MAAHGSDKHGAPLVSVVVPCLNRAHYLGPTLDSILGQDYPAIECIVIDGGSTDGTLDILKSYGDGIVWISEPDDGHADAINKGWKMSRGEILAWLNADDLYVVPDAVRKAVGYLENHPDVDVVYGDYSTIHPDGASYSGIVKPREWNLERAVRYCDNIIPQATSFIRRSTLDRIGWLDNKFICLDHSLWLRISLDGAIRYTETHIACIRVDRGLSQHADIGGDKIAITKNFFTFPNLPERFKSIRFQKRAESNAYLVGARFNLFGDGRLRTSLGFIWKAFLIDPSNVLNILAAVAKYGLLFFISLKLQERIARFLSEYR